MKHEHPTAMGISFKDGQQAFNAAIKAGKLTTNESDSNYAGNYMYMHSERGMDFFKNRETRAYDVVVQS